MQDQRDTKLQRQLVREVAGEIEAVRLKRQAQWRERPHPEGKRFTQEELSDLAYGAYKNMLLGRTLRIPLRHQLLQIADYLECSIHETNDLLLAAQYLPQQLELREDEEQALIQRATKIAQSMPLPSFVVSRGGYFQAVNRFFLELTQLPALEYFPSAKRDWIHFFFDPTLPSYHLLHASNPQVWQRNARDIIALAPKVSQPFQREVWYRAQLARGRALAGFADARDMAVTDLTISQQVKHETVVTSKFVPTLIHQDNLVLPSAG